MTNTTILQFFEWYLPNNASHWQHTVQKAKEISDLGFTHVWLPPASKGAGGINDTGYGTYDLYDLGEFDQKGSIPTKYGTKEDFLAAINALQAQNIKVLADIVFNHFLGADEKEVVSAQKFSPSDRTRPIGNEETIEAWTKFTFPGRMGKYSDDQWNRTHFSGVDWDDRRKEHAVFELEGKQWETKVDQELGNFDYLMGADLDMSSTEVISRLIEWGKWFLNTTHVDGFRLDAIKHISFTFFTKWLSAMTQHKGAPLFAVGEYWSNDVHSLISYLDASGMILSLFDVPLHFNLMLASQQKSEYDLRQIFEGSLLRSRPQWAVTFVDNHDTQPGQSLQSWVEGWFKPLAYALILLRQEGTPCVFYGDLYGIAHDQIDPVGDQLHSLLTARKFCAYGDQVDYFDDPHTIGWTRTGHEDHPHSGMAVILNNQHSAEKRMNVGAWFAGKTFFDALGNHPAQIAIEEDGSGVFPVEGSSVSVWVPEEAKGFFSPN
ncbi:MAG: alpha-amylase [Clostridiales bacterium]|nr:alpha-amylase [Clostridiales bacterium]